MVTKYNGDKVLSTYFSISQHELELLVWPSVPLLSTLSPWPEALEYSVMIKLVYTQKSVYIYIIIEEGACGKHN